MKAKLDSIPLDKQIVSKKEYGQQLADYQVRLLRAQMLLKDSRRSVVVVIEGADAAGKGGCIKRVTEKLDPRLVRVHSIIKPTEEELAHHYLWRFWCRLPARGQMAIFGRSWYGRVLVERVEKFATDEEWKRAYQEINDFERLITDDGTILLKFFLHISKEEQLRRFRAREADPSKHWKINEEDWRNRRKWNQHVEAAQEMLATTDTKAAPWHLLASNHKWWVRIEMTRRILSSLEDALAE